MKQLILSTRQIENYEDFGRPSNDYVTVIGRVIKNENENAPNNSIDLLNTDEDNPNGVQRITVTLEDIKDKTVLFEGQVVAIEGLAETSTNFIG